MLSAHTSQESREKAMNIDSISRAIHHAIQYFKITVSEQDDHNMQAGELIPGNGVG